MTINSNTELGKDIIKGGIFFGSALTPSGTFENVPQTIETTQLNTSDEPKISACLALIKEQLQNSAKLKNQSSSDILSEESINTFLSNYVQLLIDYRDLRNLVFFGSSYIEMKYQIEYLIENYPYKSYIARLTTDDPLEIIHSGGYTELIFKHSDILQPANYYFDVSGNTLRPEFELIDVSGNRFPILNLSNAISAEIINVSGTNPYTIDFKRTINSSDYGISTLENGMVFYITEADGTLKGTGIISNITQHTIPTNFTRVNIDVTFEQGYTSVIITDLIVLPPTVCSFNISGIYSSNNFITWQKNNLELYKGFIISPKLQNLISFETSIDGLKKMLLDPLNPTPWPREPVTNNIIITGEDYNNWIENPNNLILNYNADRDGFVSDANLELNIVSALTLDEEQTNQLLVRAIPHRLVDEINDIDDRYFTRFVWLAGKMFDVVKVYIDFLKYSNTLNLTPYNQLSPEFYELYAEHYGFDLFNEENINFTQTLIFTEPGLAYDNQSNAVYNNELTSQTIKQLIYERQKRLLIHLMYLYQKKGTIQSIEYLTNLLGSPKGLILIEEFTVDKTIGMKLVDNVKIHIPTYSYVVDEQYTTNPNYPVYKLQLDNEHIENLREIDINIDILGAIIEDIMKFGETIYAYGFFKEKIFANLQNPNSDYYLLPLNFPDKFSGITCNFNIPKNGLKYGWCNNEGEVSFNLTSLYKVLPIDFGIHINSIITSDALNPNETNIYIDIIANYSPSEVFINSASEIIPNGLYSVLNVVEATNQLIITIDFNSTAAAYLNLGYVVSNNPKPVSQTTKFNYKIPPFFLDYLDDQNTPLKDEVIVYNSIGSFIIPDSLDLSARNGQSVDVTIHDLFLANSSVGSSTWDDSISLEQNIILLTDAVNKLNSTNKFYAFYNVINNGFLITVVYDITSSIPPQPISVSIKTNSLTDVEITPQPVPMSTYIPAYEASDYIIARLEGKDLVIRMKVVDETTNITVQRVALYENIFYNDGLNHSLKTIYRPEGVEVYLDYKYLGLARWKEIPIYIPPTSGWTARQFPKTLIDFLNIVPLPDTLSTNPDVLPSWWDLFVGYPKGIEMYISRVSIFEMKYISEADVLETGADSSNQEVEKWVFDFSNQVKDINNNYISDYIKIQSTYRAPNPLQTWVDPTLAQDLANFFSTHYTQVNLISKNLYSGEVKFLQSVADFFIVPSDEILNFDTLFKYNSWSNTLHKDYTYENFDKVYDNYYTFAQQVLTYINLNSFVELIENKFQPLIKQFIPIVININSFGKLLKNNTAKVRYSNAHFNCYGHYLESKALASFKITSGVDGDNFKTNLYQYTSDIYEILDSISPITIKTVSEHNLLSGDVVRVSNVLGCTNANGVHTIQKIDNHTFRLVASTWNAPWTGYGDVQCLVVDFGNHTWSFSNSNTAIDVANAINFFSPAITATSIQDVVILQLDVQEFWNMFSKNANEMKFYISGLVEISEINNPVGGQIATIGNECITIQYIPSLVTNPSLALLLFFEQENTNPTYSYFETEGVNPIYTYFGSE